MTRPLTGLTGLAGYQVTIDEDSQATPEDRMGGPADPEHGKYLAEQSIPRGSRMGTPVGPVGPENQLLGDEGWFWEIGGEPEQDPQFDYTPSTHAGPWPKGFLSGPAGDIGPDATAAKLTQSYELHSMDKNGPAVQQHTRSEPLNDQWDGIDQLNPGNSDLSTLPKQSQSSGFQWGTRDRTQSMARQNEFGFDTAHQHRRWAAGSVPGNYLWMIPGGRPLVKTLAGPARPAIGPDSPFSGQDLGQAFGLDGAVLQNVPSEYVAPPVPNLTAAPVSSVNDSYPEWY